MTTPDTNLEPRSQHLVTMQRPLAPWSARPSIFHKMLALHMHQATRLAGDTDGMAEDETQARALDMAPMPRSPAEAAS